MKNEKLIKTVVKAKRVLKSLELIRIDISGLADSSDKKDFAKKMMAVSNAIIKK